MTEPERQLPYHDVFGSRRVALDCNDSFMKSDAVTVIAESSSNDQTIQSQLTASSQPQASNNSDESGTEPALRVSDPSNDAFAHQALPYHGELYASQIISVTKFRVITDSDDRMARPHVMTSVVHILQ